MRNSCCRLPTPSEGAGDVVGGSGGVVAFIWEVIRLPVHRNITFHPGHARQPRDDDPRRLPCRAGPAGRRGPRPEIDDGGGLIELATINDSHPVVAPRRPKRATRRVKEERNLSLVSGTKAISPRSPFLRDLIKGTRRGDSSRSTRMIRIRTTYAPVDTRRTPSYRECCRQNRLAR